MRHRQASSQAGISFHNFPLFLSFVVFFCIQEFFSEIFTKTLQGQKQQQLNMKKRRYSHGMEAAQQQKNMEILQECKNKKNN